MLVLWKKGRATAREITETLNQDERIAHSTVQTLLRGLERKGAVTHDVRSRTFIYLPLKNQEKARGNAAHEVIDRLFDKSPGELISYLLTHEQVTPREREQIRAILEQSLKRSRKKRRRGKKEEEPC